jgi:hypothetical protein
MKVRFAAIPKCASMTLRALSLLGEADPSWKLSPIRAYPEWEKYHWMAIERPAAEWYPSYWTELVRFRALGVQDAFVGALGLSLTDMDADLAILQDPPHIGPLPQTYDRSGVHGWVPPDFDSRYADARGRGLDFYAFVRETVIDGVPCEPLPIEHLNAWLQMHGYPAEHNNTRGRPHPTIGWID